MKCEHPSCNCLDQSVEQNGRSYCSHHCARSDTEGKDLGRCGCGHAGCD